MSVLKKLGFLGAYSLPSVILLSYYFGGPSWTFTAFIYGYVFIPLIDEVVGKDAHNIQKEAFQEVINDWYFDVLVYSHIWIQYGLIGWMSYILVFEDLLLWQQIGLVLSQGVYASTIINVSHELGHRHSQIAQWHAKAGLISVMYFHMFIFYCHLGKVYIISKL